MPIEITITVRDTDTPPESEFSATYSRKYELDDLLMMPQGHVQMWNDMIMSVEQLQKDNPNKFTAHE